MNSLATNKSLVILQFNANGLKNHINELQNVLYHRHIDTALITKTHCTKYSNFHIPGYILLKVNHPDNTAHGGVSVLLNISATPLTRNEAPRLFSAQTNRLQFQNIINEQVNLKVRLKSNLNIDEAVNNLTTLI